MHAPCWECCYGFGLSPGHRVVLKPIVFRVLKAPNNSRNVFNNLKRKCVLPFCFSHRPFAFGVPLFSKNRFQCFTGSQYFYFSIMFSMIGGYYSVFEIGSGFRQVASCEFYKLFWNQAVVTDKNFMKSVCNKKTILLTPALCHGCFFFHPKIPCKCLHF